MVQYQDKINYEFIQIEGEGETGELIEVNLQIQYHDFKEYINENHADVDLVVCGTRNQGTLKRWALGSVSDYCVHHLKCAVMVVKDLDHLASWFCKINELKINSVY